jgi:hypothetical protein
MAAYPARREEYQPWRPKLEMPVDHFIGLAVGIMRTGGTLVNDESGAEAVRYLDLGCGLKCHMKFEVYAEIVNVVRHNCIKSEIKSGVTAWNWSNRS